MRGDERFAAAMQAAGELSLRTRSVIEQIRPYAEAEDPFAAILTASDSARPYEEQQEKRIFEGPKE